MTHGSVRVESKEGFIFLHTTHDGGESDLLDLVLRLPHSVARMVIEREHWANRRILMDTRPIYEAYKQEIALMAGPFETDQFSLASFCVQARFNYLFPCPRESASRDTIEYYGYGGDAVLLLANDPSPGYFTIDMDSCMSHISRAKEVAKPFRDGTYSQNGTRVTVDFRGALAELFLWYRQDSPQWGDAMRRIR